MTYPTCTIGEAMREFLQSFAIFAGIIGLVLLLASCAGKTELPPPPPPAVEVLVPVTKPCEVKEVEKSPLPSEKGIADDIWEAVKALLADREVLLGDREKLAAANKNPCPELKP